MTRGSSSGSGSYNPGWPFCVIIIFVRRPFALIAPVFLFGLLSAQSTDLAQSYFHFTLAKMHDLNRDYSEAIVQFDKAVSLDPQSSSLRVEFARTLWDAREIRRAVTECEKAKELDPGNAAAYFWLGWFYWGSGTGEKGKMVDKAVAEVSRAVELAPRHAKALRLLGRLYLSKRDYRAALDLFSRLIRVQPGSPLGYSLKAITHFELGEIQPAFEAVQDSLRIRKSSESLKFLGTLYEETGQHEEALKVYAEAVKDGWSREIWPNLVKLLESRSYEKAVPILRELATQVPDDPQIKVQLGLALKQDKKYSEAAEIFLEVLEGNSSHVEAKYELARTQGELGQRRQAIEAFLDLLSVTERAGGNYSPGEKENRLLFQDQLGLLYQQTRQYDKAIGLYREMSRNSPDRYVPRLRLIYAFKESGRLKEALSVSDQLYQEQGQELYVAIARARILAAADKLKEASTLLKEKISEDPDEEELYSALSQLYVDHKKYQDAEVIVKKGLSLKPDSERMEFQLGSVYERGKQFERAEATFKTILERNARHAGVLNYLGYMLADRGVRLEEALLYIKRAVEIDPYNGAYLDSLGWAYFKRNELEEAEVNLKRAAQLNEPDATIYDHLGDLYYKLGQYDKAHKYYKQSVFCAKEAEELKKVRKKLSDLKELLSQTR